MVIQRIQTLYLLIAAVLMGVFALVVPVGTFTDANGQAVAVHLYDNWTMVSITLLTALLQLIDIFLYRNLKFQMKMTLLCAVFVFFTMFICAWILNMFMNDVAVNWLWPSVLTIASMVFTVMAYSCMKSDEAKLNYNRLR